MENFMLHVLDVRANYWSLWTFYGCIWKNLTEHSSCAALSTLANRTAVACAKERFFCPAAATGK